MLRGETTTRSPLDAEAVVAALQAHGVEQLRDEPSVWVIVDGSDLRKPHAAEMAHLQRVKRRDGAGTVPGYPTLNVIGVGPARRGLLYHQLYSSAAPDFVSAPAEVQTALASVGAALAPQVATGTEVTAIFDSGFDDQAVWGTVWGQGWSLVCRLCHRDRLVRPAPAAPPRPLADLAPRLRVLAQVQAEMVVRKVGQPRPKLQPVTASVAATPVVVPYHGRAAAAPVQERACWLVEIRLERVAAEPWWLLTDRPVETADQATEIFRMYCQRWAIEDAFKVAKTCLGWEEVQLLAYEAVRLLVALGWVAAGFLFALGVTLEWPEVRLLQRLGGGEARANRPPGKQVLSRGLRRLFDLLATEAIVADEERRAGGLPPRIAAMLGRRAATD
jgi:Transposase DDE domain